MFLKNYTLNPSRDWIVAECTTKKTAIIVWGVRVHSLLWTRVRSYSANLPANLGALDLQYPFAHAKRIVSIKYNPMAVSSQPYFSVWRDAFLSCSFRSSSTYPTPMVVSRIHPQTHTHTKPVCYQGSCYPWISLASVSHSTCFRRLATKSTPQARLCCPLTVTRLFYSMMRRWRSHCLTPTTTQHKIVCCVDGACEPMADWQQRQRRRQRCALLCTTIHNNNTIYNKYNMEYIDHTMGRQPSCLATVTSFNMAQRHAPDAITTLTPSPSISIRCCHRTRADGARAVRAATRNVGECFAPHRSIPLHPT